MSTITRRILKIVVFVGVFFMIGILGTMIGVVGEKTSGGNNFRTPGWAMIAAIAVPAYLCFSPWANRKIWKKGAHTEIVKNKSETTLEPLGNTFCRGDESLEELLQMVALQRDYEAKIRLLQIITSIIKRNRPDIHNQFIQKLSEIEPELFQKSNEKKEELLVQKIVKTRPKERKPKASKPKFCGNCGTSLSAAKNFCATCGNKL